LCYSEKGLRFMFLPCLLKLYLIIIYKRYIYTLLIFCIFPLKQRQPEEQLLRQCCGHDQCSAGSAPVGRKFECSVCGEHSDLGQGQGQGGPVAAHFRGGGAVLAYGEYIEIYVYPPATGWARDVFCKRLRLRLSLRVSITIFYHIWNFFCLLKY